MTLSFKEQLQKTGIGDFPAEVLSNQGSYGSNVGIVSSDVNGEIRLISGAGPISIIVVGAGGVDIANVHARLNAIEAALATISLIPATTTNYIFPTLVLTEPTTIAEYVANMGLGLNLGNYLDSPVIGAPGGWINTAQLTAAVSEGGLTNIRIPVNFAAHANAAGLVDETFLTTYVDPLVTQCVGMFQRVVLDFHGYLQLVNQHAWGEYPSTTVAYTAAQHLVRLQTIWVQIATRYAAVSSRLSFDLLNEPYAEPRTAGAANLTTPAGVTSTEWSNAIAPIVAAIRATGGKNTTRVLWVESYTQANLTDLNNLILPADANVGVSVHVYDPFTFTHQASGVALTANGTRLLSWNFDTIAAWGVAHNRKMYIGEAGAKITATIADRLTHYQSIRQFSLSSGLPVSLWDWNTDFKIYNADGLSWVSGMQRVISNHPPMTTITLPTDTTPTNGIVSDTSAGWTINTTTKTVTWPANASGTQVINIQFSIAGLANGQKYGSYGKTSSIGVAEIGLNVSHFATGVYTVNLWGYTPPTPGGNIQPITGVVGDSQDFLTLTIVTRIGAAAGSLIYSIWKEA